MHFADIHIHALYGVDDGAASEEEMRSIIDKSVTGKVDIICLTPHFHPGYYGNNKEKSEEAFVKLQDYCALNYPQLRLFLGNELHYSPDCVSWLDEGICRTINDTAYVLVDFSYNERERTIVDAMHKLQSAGYKPILAHAERYKNMAHNLKSLYELHDNGVIIQVDAQSITGDFGYFTQKRARSLFSKGLADLVGSDAHDTFKRPPQMKQAYEIICDRYGRDYAEYTCRENAMTILGITPTEGRKE